MGLYSVWMDFYIGEMNDFYKFIYDKQQKGKTCVINRKGNQLFYTHFCDNTPNGVKDLNRRIENKDGKEGVANLFGEIVIPTQYKAIEYECFGIYSVCTGCEKIPLHKNSEYYSMGGKNSKWS